MARTIHRLTVRQVASLNTPGYYADGGNLYLQVSSAGTKSWIVRYTYEGRKRDMGIGSARDVSLGRAREKAAEARAQLTEGIDPIAHRNAARDVCRPAPAAKTFRECAEAYISANAGGWSNAKHVEQWRNTLATYAHEKIGAKDVALITTADVIDILEPIWATKNETASRVRGRIESILSFAKVSGWRSADNPAAWRGHLDQILPKPSKVKKVKHHAALPYAELPDMYAQLSRMPGVAAKALAFTILTCARTSETLGAQREEFDWARRRWIVPGARMKAGREHRVPLSQQAYTIAHSMAEMAGTRLLFPSTTGGEMSNMTMAAVLKRMEMGHVTVHGFRSTFRDWAAEEGHHPAELAEMALAHTVKDKVEAAYRRGDLFKRRAALADDWADFCTSRLPKK